MIFVPGQADWDRGTWKVVSSNPVELSIGRGLKLEIVSTPIFQEYYESSDGMRGPAGRGTTPIGWDNRNTEVFDMESLISWVTKEYPGVVFE